MTEVLIGRESVAPVNRVKEVSPSSPVAKNTPPRYEAFLMTGQQIISLDHKISPRYAQMVGEQLPPAVQISETPLARRGPFDDFPSMTQQHTRTRRFNVESAVPASQSDNGLNKQNGAAQASELPAEEQHSSVTVNADGVLLEPDPSGSNLTVTSSAVSSQFSLPSVNRSPAVERRACPAAQELETSKSEPTSPAKGTFGSLANNYVSTVRCPSPPSDLDRRSEVDAEASSRLAKRLYALDGFKKSDVAAHLSKTNDFGLAVAEEYCALFNFLGVRLDAAIREFLSRFCLTGDSQERARIIEHFANRYHQCNPTLFKCPDQVHALTCALLLLHSDLHGPNVGKRMSSREFIDNLGQSGHNYDRALLKTLYTAIKEQPISWAEDESEIHLNGHIPSKDSVDGKKKKRTLRKSKSAVGEDEQIEYKAGWVVRKRVFDSDGSRTPFGRRGWRMMYARVRGMVLFLHKDENGFSRSRYETFSNAVMLHHSMAERPRDYDKKQHVFRLRTANLGEYLFQTSDPDEVQQWIDTINYVAAAFSSPALSPSVSSQSHVFHKPLLPSAPSKLSIPQQLRAHEEKEAEMRQRLEELMKEAPPLNAKGHAVQNYFYKERYLYQERERYELYANVLRARLSALSPTHSMAIRVETTVPSTSGVEIARSSSTVHTKPPISCAEIVQEIPEAEAEAMSETVDGGRAADIVSTNSDGSASRSSYKEAIALSPGVNIACGN